MCLYLGATFEKTMSATRRQVGVSEERRLSVSLNVVLFTYISYTLMAIYFYMMFLLPVIVLLLLSARNMLKKL